MHDRSSTGGSGCICRQSSAASPSPWSISQICCSGAPRSRCNIPRKNGTAACRTIIGARPRLCGIRTGVCAALPVSYANSSVRRARSKLFQARFLRQTGSPESKNIQRNSISTWFAAFSAGCARRSVRSRRFFCARITPSLDSRALIWCITRKSYWRSAVWCTASF